MKSRLFLKMPVRRVSDILDLEKVPLSEQQLPPSTYAALKAQAEKTPELPALTFFLEAARYDHIHQWSYRQLFGDITRTANVFTHLGLKQDDVVAFVLPNVPETHLTIWGGEAAGIVMPINPLLDAAHIGELLRAGRAKIVVTLAPTPGTDLWQKVSTQLDRLPEVTTVIWVDVARYLPSAQPRTFHNTVHDELLNNGKVNIVDLRTAMDAQPDDTLISNRAIRAEDRCSYFCTGGTTGLPKIACRTHGSEVFDAWAIGATLGSRERNSTFFCGLPLFHVNGQIVTGLLPWIQGDHVILGTPQGYRGEGVFQHFWQIVDHFKINFFSGVPTVYASLLQQPIGNADISSLEYAMCGAAPMPAELFRNFEKQTGVRILEGYGLTEAACASSVNPPAGERRIGSIGLRLPYQAMRVVILDGQGKFARDADSDEIGTIVVRGPNVFDGYLHGEHDTSTYIQIDGKKWLNTGDLGRQDVDGYFWLTGRSKELIIRGGHNIDPMLIEDALMRHPQVQIAAAVPRPDPHSGELPVAYVQLRPGAAVSEATLLQHVRENVGERAAWPKAIRFIDKMPQTAVGKLFKPALKNLEIEDALLHALGGAGVRDSRLQVSPDNQLGVVINATVDSEQSKKTAESVLSQYSFPFRIFIEDAALCSEAGSHA